MILTPRSIAASAAAAVLAAAILAGGCSRHPQAASGATTGDTPVAAVNQLVKDLRGNDLVAYADHALPPKLHQEMAMAWSEGRTTWPLSELPLSEQLPGFIITLAEPDAEKTLLAAFRRQFAGAGRELRTAASTLGLFAAQYVERSSSYSDAEREHYVQLIVALSTWGKNAPLADPALAKAAVPQLVAAARLTGLGHPGALREAGMERSLTRLGPLLARLKSVLDAYGLDINATLDGAQVRLIEQTGDTAQVSLSYPLAGATVDAQIALERRDGRWYLSNLLRHAEQEAAAPSPAATPAAREARSRPLPH
ncbi:hypothetical protein INQ41_12355 [Lysobacter ciconiae]|uniref:Lipoprotein n=1 Tax=Novilysobacter ciconiae TaxID=2781022 RepID=A0A7S6UFL4_9GAMM|nr:hypothetical protein [Lysobacter ciconiae]QOW19386.1 hypothetical protein INQ41_12355 [Lysobacter ciconiae]